MIKIQCKEHSVPPVFIALSTQLLNASRTSDTSSTSCRKNRAFDGFCPTTQLKNLLLSSPTAPPGTVDANRCKEFTKLRASPPPPAPPRLVRPGPRPAVPLIPDIRESPPVPPSPGPAAASLFAALGPVPFALSPTLRPNDQDWVFTDNWS